MECDMKFRFEIWILNFSRNRVISEVVSNIIKDPQKLNENGIRIILLKVKRGGVQKSFRDVIYEQPTKFRTALLRKYHVLCILPNPKFLNSTKHPQLILSIFIQIACLMSRWKQSHTLNYLIKINQFIETINI